MAIRCLLVDDEPPAIELLKKHISLIEDLEVVDTSPNAIKALNVLRTKSVDLIFLDIQMPKLTGLEFLKTLKHPPSVILTTAYRDYALESYEFDVIDYLLKPISFDRFLHSVEKYHQRLNKYQQESADNPSPHRSHIFLNINKKHYRIEIDQILFVESLKDYVRIHFEDSNLLLKTSLASFLDMLPVDDFVRIHRSYAVSRSKVSVIGSSFVEIQDRRLPIGSSYRASVQKDITRG
ncbi:LytR/AlgR family response regulator transcription factor [Reichenbachiella versicolor]|uniref:LytR/AlgR family response regulator transcription factor n=1 Tax=Reichenbachiella versicolor TaxID=1821036 RepID=UPI000D6EA6A0|nr:response regulator transcription factor [Reichenbachiella versicolor]